jgi:hypothetical protein
MLFILITVTFIACVMLIFAKDSFFDREFRIYQLTTQHVYLAREQLRITYKTFNVDET